jgi:murein DD-endopeptidase MepM/ murein hydrolase activator NlpD
MPRKIFVLVMLVILVTGNLSALAQDDGQQSPSTPGFIVHVVQRDETLFQIAQQYGSTLDSIITVNSIIDPDQLQVGQRLIILENDNQVIGVLETHIVEPGETLFTIAERYNSTPESLAQVNNIFNARLLYVGESILVTRGANGTLPQAEGSVHIVQPSDNLLRLSLKYQVSIRDLAEWNDLDPDNPLQVGQRIVISGSSKAGRFVSLPAPILDFRLAPLPAEQGRSLGAFIQATGDVTINGKIFGKDLRFARQDDGYHAIIGIHSFTEPGIYPFTITVTDATGQQTIYETRIRVEDGGYGQESIDIPPERQNLLAPEVVQAELDRVAGIMSGYIEQRYFDGLMNLPSTGPVTSQYGTRRSYNGSGFDTFHGGADFGGAEGSTVMAPAAGIVVLAEPLQVRGNTVIIDHGWGVYTGYWHNQELFVQAGQFVQRGDVISSLGATGLVTGAHLHWEMWVSGVQVDPLQWVVHAFDDFETAP